jgi:hypothetical protein
MAGMSNLAEEYEALCACPGHAGAGEHYIPCNRPAVADALLCATCYSGKPLCWNRACSAAGTHPHAQQETCLCDLLEREPLL